MKANCKLIIGAIVPQRTDSDTEPIDPLEHYFEGISTLKKNQSPAQLHPNAFDKGLFTVRDIIEKIKLLINLGLLNINKSGCHFENC